MKQIRSRRTSRSAQAPTSAAQRGRASRPTPSRPAPRAASASAYDSQKRCIHAAHLIAAGHRDAQVTAATGLNLCQVRVVRRQYGQGRSGANGLSAAVGTPAAWGQA